MIPSAALLERDRWIVVGTGLAAFALIHVGLAGVLRPWDFGDGDMSAYPPHARLLLLPFGAMPMAAAVAIWSALNLFCVYRAAELMSRQRDLALLACVSPAALTMIVSGYAGGLLALLATVVLLQGHKRPGLAGLNLALMTVQPQLALLFAVVLLLVGYWRAVALAIPWTLALLAASLITFGVQPWTDFVDPQAHHPAAAISLDAAARLAGLPDWTAQAMQWSFGVAALAGAALVFARRGPEPRSIALLLLAVILALPHAGAGDLAIAAPALTLALFAHGAPDERPFLPFAPALLLWTMPAVASLLVAAASPIVPVIIAAILLYALAREIARRPALIAYRVETERKGTP